MRWQNEITYKTVKKVNIYILIIQHVYSSLKETFFLSQIRKDPLATRATDYHSDSLYLHFIHPYNWKWLDVLTIPNLNVFISKMGLITTAVRITRECVCQSIWHTAWDTERAWQTFSPFLKEERYMILFILQLVKSMVWKDKMTSFEQHKKKGYVECLPWDLLVLFSFFVSTIFYVRSFAFLTA